MTADGFAAFAAEWTPRVEATLESLVPPAGESPTDLHRAMRHALFPGGKRLRPLLALLAARVTGGDPERALRPGAALELLHTYSLVHDDLPCMDDDDLRRGRPTCHKVFGDAVAVLAGDALLTLAFEIVAEAGAEAVRCLAAAAGSRGMVGGQAADLAAEGSLATATLDGLQSIHDRKTGALIVASLEVGAIAGGATFDREGLRGYGERIGRAFQIADDCLDVTGTAEEIGKPPGSDVGRDKLTYPALIGLEAAQQLARDLANEAAELAPRVVGTAGGAVTLDAGRKLLQDLASRVATRSS
ncbi:MAG: polyprenyl synthetase family protein [Planctomycetes bacterium]|nr:polyprenyl synthetase family protein [Planctomycetota bacterium]